MPCPPERDSPPAGAVTRDEGQRLQGPLSQAVARAVGRLAILPCADGASSPALLPGAVTNAAVSPGPAPLPEPRAAVAGMRPAARRVKSLGAQRHQGDLARPLAQVVQLGQGDLARLVRQASKPTPVAPATGPVTANSTARRAAAQAEQSAGGRKRPRRRPRQLVSTPPLWGGANILLDAPGVHDPQRSRSPTVISPSGERQGRQARGRGRGIRARPGRERRPTRPRPRHRPPAPGLDALFPMRGAHLVPDVRVVGHVGRRWFGPMSRDSTLSPRGRVDPQTFHPGRAVGRAKSASRARPGPDLPGPRCSLATRQKAPAGRLGGRVDGHRYSVLSLVS